MDFPVPQCHLNKNDQSVSKRSKCGINIYKIHDKSSVGVHIATNCNSDFKRMAMYIFTAMTIRQIGKGTRRFN